MNYNEFLGNAFDVENGEFNHQKVKEKAIAERGKTNILLIGATGVGKSSLINAIFGDNIVKAGVGKPVTQHLEKIEIKEKGLVLWDTKGIEAKDYKKTTETIITEIENGFNSLKSDEAPHLAWLCIKETAKRIEDREEDLLNFLQKQGIPTIIVFTNTQSEAGDEFYAEAQKILNQKYAYFIKNRYVRVNSTEYKIQGHTITKSGLDELLQLSENAFPEGAKNAKQNFLKIQQVNIAKKFEAMLEGSRKIVHIAAASAGTVGASPIPGSDAPLIAAIQSAMIYKLNTEFEVSTEEATMTSLITGILGATALAQVGKTIVGNLLKFIPVAGAIVGGAIGAVTAVAITEAVGHAYIEVLKHYFNRNTGKVEFPPNTKEILEIFKSVFKPQK